MIGDFERRFSELSARAKAELLQLRKSVDTVCILLKTLSAKDFHEYVHALRGRPPSNFDELFDDLKSYRWNCFEYELLEAVIRRNNCSTALRRDMERYAHDVREFQQHTTVSKSLRFLHGVLKRKSRLKGYKRLTTRFNVNPDKCMLETINRFGEKVQSDSKFPLHLYDVKIGSVIVQWSFFEEHEYTLIVYLCSEGGKDLLKDCEISEVLIDDSHP